MAYPREVNLAKKLLVEKGAEEVEVINVSSITPFADYYVIATCPSERALGGFSDALDEEYAKAGFEVKSITGTPESQWVIVDEGDVIIHLFTEYKRREIDLAAVVAHSESKATR
ncbi:MAG: ribosome silencing factor [Bacilli bacterium]|nr:ribosome silencing factor [Bacilli bacterium]